MLKERSSIISAIKLGEAGQVPTEVQMFKVGKFSHPRYGNFEITPVMLQEFKKNFDDRVRGVDICFDYYHDSDKDASGWPKSLELREGGNELWAVDVDWTPTAAKKLADRELRYFSPDFAFKWTDEKGQQFKNVINGGGLTNRPFLKEMAAIVANEPTNLLPKGDNKMDEKDQKLADMQKQLDDLQAMLTAMKSEKEMLAADKTKLEEENKKLLGEKVEADKAKQLAEREGKFNVLLSEGKACVAQKEAFLANDTEKFISLAEPLNTKGKGSSSSKTTDDSAESVIKLAEEKMTADKSLTRPQAILAAQKELKK